MFAEGFTSHKGSKFKNTLYPCRDREMRYRIEDEMGLLGKTHHVFKIVMRNYVLKGTKRKHDTKSWKKRPHTNVKEPKKNVSWRFPLTQNQCRSSSSLMAIG